MILWVVEDRLLNYYLYFKNFYYRDRLSEIINEVGLLYSYTAYIVQFHYIFMYRMSTLKISSALNFGDLT
jgi:hypothetical protein